MSDYVGLPNVSKHKAQLKINYSNEHGFFVNARIIYRSKWAVNNTNGNEVYDNGDDFAQSYYSLHSSIGKEYQNGLTVQLGADNINNYIDAIHLPNLAGRTYFINLKYQIKYKH
jgi:hypothetical protein